MITNSHAFIPVDLKNIDVQNSLNYDSGIIDIGSDFFTENDFKRYLIFGKDLQKNDFLKNNAIYGIESNNGLFLGISFFENVLIISD